MNCQHCDKPIPENREKFCSPQCAWRRWYVLNKTKKRAQAKKWALANPDKIRNISKRMYRKNKDVVDQRTRQWQARNRDKVRASRRKNRINNPQKEVESRLKRKYGRKFATPRWLSRDDWHAMRLTYLEARKLTAEGNPHQVDHIVPIQGRDVCGLHVPANLAVIPALDNQRKGNRTCFP